ncbi:hypothetical protein CC80DRAFT_556336 [Byssothecium circinans]|uniref:Heterokaryon incompatibility domain-containing protein n=1 Tax=Byssothecium circinans TaxID=147558 RepID=A0A6A5T8H3_9PLEO|nr:hypothetical protein CC80DRAFT_556336 [Byssothecium circinans]
MQEKQHQVRLMRKIWVGDVNDHIKLADADAVFQLLAYLSDPGSHSLPLAVTEKGHSLKKALIELSSHRNQWWKRIWTVQEGILPEKRVFQWGPLNMSMEALQQAIGTLSRKNNSVFASASAGKRSSRPSLRSPWTMSTWSPT